MRENSGRNTTKGIIVQNYAALSLFLQFLRDSNFLYIHLEAPKFQDFNLVFNDGHKIICESKDWGHNFSYADLRGVLKSLNKKGAIIGDNDEILIICTNLDKKLERDINTSRFFRDLRLKELENKFKAKKYTDNEIRLLDKVKFWQIDPKYNEKIVYSLFSSLINEMFGLWMPADELIRFINSYLFSEILKGSSKGDIIKKEDIFNEIENYKKSIAKKLGTEKEKKEKKYKNLLKNLKDGILAKMPDWHKMDFSTCLDEMSFVLSKLKDNKFKIKIKDLSKWDKFWELNVIWPFSFGVFNIFEKNLHTIKNKQYVINFINKNLDKIRGFYRSSFFEIDVVKILDQIIKSKDGKKYITSAFKIVVTLLTDNKDNLFYLKDKSDSDLKKKEICEFLEKIYNLANKDLKEKIYQLIIENFNLVEDDGNFSHYTPRSIFNIIKKHLTSGRTKFESNFKNLVVVLGEQYDKYYKRFGTKLNFKGWELIGGTTGYWAGAYKVSDRHFILYTLKPALDEYYKKNEDKAWKFIKKNCVFSEKQVNKNKPDFLNRSVISIILKRYKSDKKKTSDEAFKILKEFILSKKGIPAKAELIYQEVATGSFSADQKWKLVKISLEKNKTPDNPFVEKIVRDLIKTNHPEVKKTILSWIKSKEYFKRFRFEIQAVQNIYAFLDVDFEFAVDLFKKFISNPIFIKEYDNFETYNVAILLHDIMQKEFKSSGDIKISAGIINGLLNKEKLSPNEQVVACFSIFSHRGDDNADRKELLILAYDKIVKPFLDKFKGTKKQKAQKIVKVVTQSNPREAFVQFASRLANNKEIDKALSIVEIFINDPDPYLPGKGPEGTKGKYNEHKKILEGEEPTTITSVRGWCAWTLMGCSVLAGRKYIDKIIEFTERLLKDENYYVRHMACFSLEQLMRNRLTVLPTNKDVLFLDPSGREEGKTKGKDLKNALKKSQKIEKVAFGILKEFTNKRKYNDNVRKALFKSVLRPFNYFRVMNQAQVVEFFKLVKQYPDEVIAEAVPLLIYFAEIRRKHYKKWRWKTEGLYDDLQSYNPKPFQEEIKKLIQTNNSKINRQFVYHFYQLTKTAPEKVESGDVLNYDESFKVSYHYLKLIVENYNHEAYRQIYLFINENLDKRNKECADLLIYCYEKEKEALESGVRQGKAQEVYWWPFYNNGDILVKIKNDNRFLKAFNTLVHYPEEVQIGQIDNAVQRLERICKNKEQVEKIFEELIKRKIQFVEYKKRWKKNCFKK